ncbi:unnamed protein product [Paramecium sonneborni]|uniref:Chorein N-terminal domain-containing protein n=1 Tax=Paramecium sonneborni TaxID=65129 RepID=A0A8S1RDG9_9CILI|nr:unnamed protein product [Paramecium sonneborni]
MSKEIEEYFIKRLSSYLLEYLQDFSQNNMAKFSLGISSNIVLKNLSIKKQALLNFKFPLYIIDGKINSITLNMPLNYKKHQPEIIIEGVELLVCTIQEINQFTQSKDYQQQGVENLKKHKLKLWEEQMAKYFEKLSPPNWIQKIVDGIFNNMSITIKQFNLRFYNSSILEYKTVLRIKFDAFIKATDSEFKQNFNSDLNSTYRLIQINNLSVSLKKDSFKDLTKKDAQMILMPIDIEIMYTVNKNYELLNQPIMILEVLIKSPIIFQLNKEQKNYLIKLNEVLSCQEIIQDNFHLRPKEIKNNYSEWWKYFINSVILKQKSQKLDLSFSYKKLVSMKRYIQLYKRKQNIVLVPWLSQWTAKDEIKFKNCEDNLSLKDLLKYREWAFQEIRMEAKRYYNSAKDGQNDQSVKPLLEIWTNTINNQNSFKDHTKRTDDIPIELEDDEKINLYEILERDKTNVLASYLKGENNHPNQLKIDFKLKIHSIFILIFENREFNFVKYTPDNTKIFKFCQCRYHLKLLKKQTSTRKKTRQSSQVNALTQVYNEAIKQNEDQQFHQANYIDSFYEDMEDLNGVGSEISQSSKSCEKDQNFEQNSNADKPLHSKFVIMVSFIGIRVPLNIYQNGAIQTPQHKGQKELEEKIYIGDIKVIAPGILLKIMDEKEPKNFIQSPLFKKSSEEFQTKVKLQNKQNQIKYCEFFNEIFELSVTRDSQQFLNSEICYQMLGEFLKYNKMQNIKSFLDDYEKDKNGFQDFTTEQFKAYDKYFDDLQEPEDPFFIHISKQQFPNEKSDKNEKNFWDILRNVTININEKEKQNQWIICDNNNKHIFLQEAHNRIVDVIRRVLFIPFIEQFGVLILPTCISNLKDKLTFTQIQTKKDQSQEKYALQISLYLRGKEPEYKIVRNNQLNKVNSKETIYQNFKKSKSKIKVKLTAITFLLSTKAVTSLLYFLENQKQQIFESQAYQQCKEDHNLLQCIVKSKPLANETINQLKLKFSLKMIDKFKIRIITDSISSKIKTELKLQLKNLFINTINLQKMRQNKDFIEFFTFVDTNKLDQFFQEQKLYCIKKIVLEQFQIAHKYFSIDYRYYNEEMKNYEKQMQNQKSGKEQQNSPLLNFQRNYSQQLQKPIQFPIKHTITIKSQQEDKLSNQQNQFQSKPQNKISGIKSIILESRLLLFQFDSLVENHPLITDKKIFIQIPYFNLQINDSQICLIELLIIINKKLKQKEKKKYREFRYQMSKDSLMRAELLMLQKDHKKQKRDCKHCILRFRKSLHLTNIIFGLIPKIQNGINLFSLFEFENYIIFQRTQQKKIEKKVTKSLNKNKTFVETQKNFGIQIQFKSTPKASKSICYITAFEMPLFIITHDKGYFKETIAIHCKKTPINPEMSQSNKLQNPEIEKYNSFKDQLQFQPYQQQSIIDEINESDIEKTNIIFEPQLLVQDCQDLSDKLDDKFIFYCRNKEKEMFNHDFAEYEDKDQFSYRNLPDSQNDKDQLYLLFYFHNPLRANLLLNVAEEFYQERHQKMKLFFAIENIKATFINQFATYNLITILKNINTIMNIQENAFNLINKDLLKKEQRKVKLKENPLKTIDEMIICAIIQNIYLKSNETSFKLSQLKVFIQIYLMDKYRYNNIQKRSSQSYYPQGINSIQIPKNRTSINNDHEADLILRCDIIKFNFNQVSKIDIKKVIVTKQKGELSLSVDDIQISIMGKQRENLFVMPVKEIGGQKAKYALHINLSFQNSYPLIKAQVEQAKIILSQQKIQDLLIAINSFYLINIEETISLKQHLLKYIFQQELYVFDIEEKQVNIFVNQISKYKKTQKFASELTIDSLIIKLQEQEKDFFLFLFHSIYFHKKNQSNLKLSIQQIEMKPQNLTGEQIIYPNLIQPIDNKQTVVFNLENKIISIRNIRFYLISRYIKELQAFQQKVETILQKNLDELKEKYQKDFDLQLQIKHEEDFLKEKDNFNYSIKIQNSQFVLPETSQDHNYLIATFQKGHINLKKQKILLKLPEIDDDKLKTQQQSINQSLFIDYQEQMSIEKGEFYVINIFGCFNNVLVRYQMHNNQVNGELLKAEQITTNMDIPSFEQNCGLTQWKFKDQCKLEINQLKMSLDLGKLMKIQNFFTKNQDELSPLFNFKKSLLQKINFEVQFNDSKVALTRYNQGEPEKRKQIKEKSKVYNKQARNSKNFFPKN